MMISRLKKEQEGELVEALVQIHGEDFRDMALATLSNIKKDGLRCPIFFVAIQQEKIIGAVCLSKEFFSPDCWRLSWFGVSPAFQNQGIGTALVKACEQEIAKHTKGKGTAILSGYPELKDFYRKLGFHGSTQDHLGGLIITKTIEGGA